MGIILGGYRKSWVVFHAHSPLYPNRWSGQRCIWRGPEKKLVVMQAPGNARKVESDHTVRGTNNLWTILWLIGSR